MNSNLNWDDLRLILAVDAAGTLSGAGRVLEVSHATVFRRLGNIENRLGVKLFERSRTGYSATLAGEEAAVAARRIQTEVLDVERRIVGRDLRPSGTVRVTTTDTLLVGLLSPVLTAFRQAYDEIDLEIAVSNDLLSLSRREADVAIRPSSALPEALSGRKIGVIAQAIYGRGDVIESSAGEPDIQAMVWIGPDDTMAYRLLERWMAEQGLTGQVRCRINTVMGMFAAAKAGAGLAVLPCYLGDGEKELVRFGGSLPELSTDLWLLTHPDLRDTVRIRVFMDFLAQAARDLSPRLG